MILPARDRARQSSYWVFLSRLPEELIGVESSGTQEIVPVKYPFATFLG